MKGYISQLKEIKACREAVAWCETGGYKTLDKAWQACERGDWMLWLAGRLSGKTESRSRKKVVLVACQCARLSLPYVQKGEERPLQAIETAEKWANGDMTITLDMVRAAAYAASAAARIDTLKQCADKVRKFYPTAPIKEGK
mgnify:CR=1 FL=1